MFWGICIPSKAASSCLGLTRELLILHHVKNHKGRMSRNRRNGAGREGAKTGLESFQSAELVTDPIRGRQISSLRAPLVFKNGCNSIRTVAG